MAVPRARRRDQNHLLGNRILDLKTMTLSRMEYLQRPLPQIQALSNKLGFDRYRRAGWHARALGETATFDCQ